MIIVDLGIHKLKRILTFGDSWVEGGGLDDPNSNKLYNEKEKQIPSPEEAQYISVGRYKDSYKLKHSWTGYLDRLIDTTRDDWSVDKPHLDNIERGALNFGRGGLSNAGIVDKVLKVVSVFNGNVANHEGLFKYGWSGNDKDEFTEDKFNPNDYFVIVSWTTFYRDRMFNMNGDGMYQTWGINSLTDNANGTMNPHIESYIDGISNLPYLIEKYLNQCLYLHFFLKSCNIKHMFYNSFNETVDVIKSIHNHKLVEMNELKETIRDSSILLELYTLLPNDIFYKNKMWGKSQLKFLIEHGSVEHLKHDTEGSMFLSDSHPSQMANKLWSKELYNTKQIQDFLNAG